MKETQANNRINPSEMKAESYYNLLGIIGLCGIFAILLMILF